MITTTIEMAKIETIIIEYKNFLCIKENNKLLIFQATLTTTISLSIRTRKQ